MYHMHHSGIGCLSFQGDAGKPRNGSHPIQILGWRSLSGKVTHKVAHNDASISERNLKADSDHDQGRLPHCHRINRTFWVMHNHSEIVRKCIVY